jgi:DNA-binding transcriptional LysR family regulator
VHVLPRLTQKFHHPYSDIKIELVCDHFEGLVADLRQHQLDLAFVAYCPTDDDLEHQPIMTDCYTDTVSSSESSRTTTGYFDRRPIPPDWPQESWVLLFDARLNASMHE